MANPFGHGCVVGLGWGDEGKGKIVDLLAADYDVVVRYNGGANAGHTVRIGQETFALHLLPSGVLHPEKLSVIGPGVVVDLQALVDEIEALESRGQSIGTNLAISDRAHLVMPYHKIEDRLAEQSAAEESIGTTARGIGPCYADKMRRYSAIRICDLFHECFFRRHLSEIIAGKKATLEAMFHQPVSLDADAIADDLLNLANRLQRHVCDTTQLLGERSLAGQRFLFEGANGILLDVDHGTYPYVTSSTTTPGGVASGAGVSPRSLSRIVGVTKAYSTRVGCGPFVSELNGETGERIRKKGHEYGTTTGRPRRCGWFDAVAARYSVRLAGVTEVALMHLDTLSGFEDVNICVAYERDGRRVESFPSHVSDLEKTKPILERLPGWQGDLSQTDSFDRLPREAQDYIRRVESLLECPIGIVSVGPERSQTLTLKGGPVESTRAAGILT